MIGDFQMYRFLFLGFFSLLSVFSSQAWSQVSASPNPSNTGSYTISWPSGHGSVTIIEEKSNSGTVAVVYKGIATQVTLSGKTNGSYTYKVISDRGGGCLPGWDCFPSNVGSVTVSVALSVAPGAPGAISAPSVSSGSFQVSWGAASGNVDRYQLQESINGSAWNTIQNTTARSKSLSKSTGNYYDYRVRACNQVGCSAYTAVKRVSVPLPVPGVPGAISAPSTSTTGSYTVSWGASSGSVSSYQLQERMNGGSWATVQNNTSLSRSFSKPAGTFFEYRARACNSSGCGEHTFTRGVAIPEGSVSASVDTSFYIYIPASVTLDWNSSMTSGCSIFGQALSGASGSASVNVPFSAWQIEPVTSTWSTSLVVTCDVIGGATMSSSPVTVSASQYEKRPNVTAGWNVSEAGINDSAVFSWSSSGADSCQIDGQSVAVTGAKSFSFNSLGTHSKTVRCENLGGERSASASVVVSVPDTVVTAHWSEPSVVLGTPATLSWSSSHADSCQLDGESVSLIGSQSFSYSFAGTFSKTISCENLGGATTASAVVSVNPPVVTTSAQNPANDTLEGSAFYGALRGEHSIDKSGAFTYAIPIDAPPGINGMAPNMGLGYSSAAQNGVMGWGWNISGLSSISRCPASIARDGYPSGINSGDSYKFCLDGQRLVELPSGEYRTESESFKRITRVSDYWLVENPDGSKAYYGSDYANNAKTLDNGDAAISWLIDKKVDATGNYITYVYETAATGKNVSIKEVQYTKSESGAQGTNNTIEFFYEDRDDITSHYVANTLFEVGKRLRRVESKANGTLVYSYTINYETIDNVDFADPVHTSRVASIEKCFASDATCADAVNFGWTSTHQDNYVLDTNDVEYVIDEDIAQDRYFTVEGGEGLLTRVVESGVYPIPASVGGRKPLLGHGVRGDFDGDNRLEVIWVDCASPGDQTCDRKVAMNAGDAGTTFVHTENYEYFDPNLGGQLPPSDFLFGRALDFNGDGLDDYYIKKVKSMDVYISDGTTLNYSSGYSMSQSQLGTVRASVCCDATLESVIKYWQYEYVFKDFNGDGLVDILRMPKWDTEDHIPTMSDLNITDVSVAINNGNGFEDFDQWGVSTDFIILNQIVSSSYLNVADVNGDQLVDLVGLDGQVGINTGASFVADSSWRQNGMPGFPSDYAIYVNVASVETPFNPSTVGDPVPGYSQRGFRRFTSEFDPLSASTAISDVNGDGLVDIVAIREEGIYVSLSDGETFLPAELWSAALDLSDVIPYCNMMECNTSRRGFVVQDANGDGMADILFTKAWNGDVNKNASEVIALYSKGHRDANGGGFASPIVMASVAPFPDGTPLDVVWNQDVQRVGKPGVTEDGNVVVHLQPNFRDAEAAITLGIPLIEVIDIAMDVGLKKHKILEVQESASRRLSVSYKKLSDSDVYIQTGGTGDGSKIGARYPTTYTYFPGEGEAVRKTDHGIASSARGMQVAASIDMYEHNTLATHESYFYKNRRSHRRGLGSLGFEEIQKTTTLAGQSQKLRTVTEFLQEVGDEASYILAVPKRTINCAITNASVEGCDASSGVSVLSEHSKNWQVRVYDDSSLRFHAYPVEEYIQNYDLNSGDWVNTVSKRLYDDGVRSSCPALSDITSDNRTTTTDDHFDAYGTPLDSVENRCDTFGVTGTHTDNNNVLNDTGNWCLNLVQDPSITTWVHDDEASVTDSQTRHTNYAFYTTGGGKCRVRTEIREPSKGNDVWLSTLTEYNEYGSPESVAQTTKAFSGDGVSFTTRTTRFDESYSSLGEKTLVITTPLNHITTKIFNAEFGSVKQITDPNDILSMYWYDQSGRLFSAESAGVITLYDYRTCDNCFAYNTDAAWYVQEKSEGQSATRKYFDSLDREVGSRWRGLTGTHYFTGKKYNALGLPAAVTEPFENHATAPSLETRTHYDVLGRIKRTDFPTDATQTVAYTVVDGAATVITTDSGGKPTEQRFDALGREKTVKDPLNVVVSYTHDAQGNVAAIEVADEYGGNAINHGIEFDMLGRKTRLNDPDVGNIFYRYNAFGHLVSQRNDENERICYAYDVLDRQIQRRDGASSDACTDGILSSWVYDTNGIGLLAQINGRDTRNRVQTETYDYTLDYLLPETVTRAIDGELFTVSNTYDIFNRPVGFTYPTGFTLMQRYNSYGVPYQSVNASTGEVLWEASADDARGNMTQVNYGNGASVSSLFRPETGLLQTRQATLGSATLQDHSYSFDDEGNLRRRQDHRVNITQDFCYDELYRVTDQVINGSCNDSIGGNYSGTAYAYDIHGNLTRKDGISDYLYGGSAQNAGPHAVSRANGGSYRYDNAGRLISRPQSTVIDYSLFGKPTYMGSSNGYQTEVVYGAAQTRVWRGDVENGQLTETVYIGKDYERIDNPDGSREHRHYLGDWGVHVNNEADNEAYNVYFTRDHIGSMASKSDDRTSPTIKFHANEPWGRRQDKHWNGQVYDTLSGSALKEMTFGTTRGFTDHEHLDGVGLIHMNGRVYDPIVGRFVSPDPWIQDPKNSQSFNRYSYVWNNPLRYTDPTGEFIPLIIVAVKVVGWGMAAYGLYDGASTVAENVTDVALGEKTATQALKDGGTSLAIDAALTLTGTRVVKAADKLTDKFAPGAKEKAKDAVSNVVGKVAGNKNSTTGDLNAAAPIEGKVEKPTDLQLTPGTTQTVDPNMLSTNRNGLDSEKLDKQRELVAEGTRRDTMIEVDQTGKIIDGNHGAKASSEYAGENVDVKVIEMPGSKPGDNFVKDLKTHDYLNRG